MHYGNIKKLDIANGEGIRTSLFVSGCRNHCEHCFQPETWDFHYGRPFSDETAEEVITSLAPAYVDGLTVLGGEPFEPENQRELVCFLRRVRKLRGTGHPHCEVTEEMLELIDVLVDGRFVERLKNLSLRFRGSSNQRVIDLKRTLEEGSVALYLE